MLIFISFKKINRIKKYLRKYILEAFTENSAFHFIFVAFFLSY